MIDKMISGKTKICGIIGDPIEHTMSPEMQNAAFKATGSNYIYVPFRVDAAKLEKAIQGVRALNIRGFNITIPHKVSVIPFLDEIDSLAEMIGAVNTVVNSEGILKGYNTDASGFLKALDRENIDISGKKIAILGSGGAARAIAYSLSSKGANLTIISRNQSSAVDLAERLKVSFRTKIKTLEMNEESINDSLAKADLFVNATSLGMMPKVGASPVPAELIKKGLVIFDIIYNPSKTKLLEESEKRGARGISGVEMLVCQGAEAFELWTGVKAPLEIMRTAVMKGLLKIE
jgi:shikimate dehydrogenase